MSKDVGGGIWAAAAIENPETHVGVVVLPTRVSRLSGSPNAQAPSATFASSPMPTANGISTDQSQDLIGWLMLEPGWGHFELKGIGRSIRARFDDRNRSTLGGEVGVAALLALSRNLDIPVKGLAGRIIGRYAAVGPDVAIGPDGSVHPVQEVQAITGFVRGVHSLPSAVDHPRADRPAPSGALV